MAAGQSLTSETGVPEGGRMMNALAGLVKRYSSPEFSVAHGGHVLHHHHVAKHFPAKHAAENKRT